MIGKIKMILMERQNMIIQEKLLVLPLVVAIGAYGNDANGSISGHVRILS